MVHVLRKDLTDLFDEAGAVQGKLQEDQFGDFIDLLADSLGLEEVGGDYDTNMMDDDEDDDDDDEEESDDIESTGLGAKLLMDDFAIFDDFNDAGTASPPAAGKGTTSTTNKGTVTKNKISTSKLSTTEDEDDDEEMDFGLGSGKPSEPSSISSLNIDSKKASSSSSSSVKSNSLSSSTTSSSSPSSSSVSSGTISNRNDHILIHILVTSLSSALHNHYPIIIVVITSSPTQSPPHHHRQMVLCPWRTITSVDPKPTICSSTYSLGNITTTVT